MKNQTICGALGENVGFPKMDKSHKVTKKAITRVHTPNDEGKKFKDNFEREYIYTSLGCIY